ncbi:MAG: radical SAM protein [Candidatus Portnoybacteria bacterium]|nr:radical SAM protein [Candidatus Portnoybacteria bacterium]MDD4982487.1 radical SAM protein [Candidatus Portnoybacteria bacterium]
MKILLINPPVCNEINHASSSAPPLALLYLAGYLRQNGYPDIKVVDAEASRLTWDKLKELLQKEKPDIIGATGVSLIFPALVKTVKLVKKTLPGAKIIVGGFAATTEPEKILRESSGAISFVVKGEGELTLLELVKKIEKQEADFRQVKGIAYLDQQGQFITTEPREYIKDLSTVPWPAYDLLDKDPTTYKGMPHDFEGMRRPVAVMLTTRGCPHRCAFCSLGSKMHRERDIKDAVDEIEFYHNKFGANSIQLYDDEFIGMSPKQNERVVAFCDEIIRRGLNKKLSFLTQGRCSQFVDLPTLKKMREANFVWIWWGVESGSQKILDFIHKDITIASVKRTFDLAKQAGIKRLMFIMVGFPKETPADIKLSADLIKKVKPDQVAIHIMSPYPGSELRKYLEEHKLLDNDDYYSFDTRMTVNHHTEELSAQEIKKYYQMMIFRFETGYWYFFKFLLRSLASANGWKNLGRRVRTAFSYLLAWGKMTN